MCSIHLRGHVFYVYGQNQLGLVISLFLSAELKRVSATENEAKLLVGSSDRRYLNPWHAHSLARSIPEAQIRNND